MTACCLVKSLRRTGDGSGGHVHEAAGFVFVFTFFSPLFFWYMLQTLDCGAFINYFTKCWLLVPCQVAFAVSLAVVVGTPTCHKP